MQEKLQKTSIVYTQPGCAGCVTVKTMLSIAGYAIEERVLGAGWTKEDLWKDAPNCRSVPQVIIGGKLIGNLANTMNFLDL